MRPDPSSFFVTGGALSSEAPSYIPRRADRELIDALRAGEFCYVLTARQMGKSSLMVRAVSQLRAQNVDAVVIDLTAIGLQVTAEQWYRGLLTELGEQLGLEEELGASWHAHAGSRADAALASRASRSLPCDAAAADRRLHRRDRRRPQPAVPDGRFLRRHPRDLQPARAGTRATAHLLSARRRVADRSHRRSLADAVQRRAAGSS